MTNFDLKLSNEVSLINTKQVLGDMSTLDIVKALSQRDGVVCNSVVSDNIAVATIFIVSQEDQDELTKFCSERFIELAAG